MFCIPSMVVIACAIKMTFVEYYRAACYDAPAGQYWAAQSLETQTDVVKRVLDATALYQDYLESRREQCSGTLHGSLVPEQ